MSQQTYGEQVVMMVSFTETSVQTGLRLMLAQCAGAASVPELGGQSMRSPEGLTSSAGACSTNGWTSYSSRQSRQPLGVLAVRRLSSA